MDVIIRKDRRAGRITLNRPDALNALTHAMVLEIGAALRDWQADPGVQVVILDATGPRAFCAGGDIGAIYRDGRAGELAAVRRFFRDEYRMNVTLAEYPRPVVAFLQGYVMGGGIGLGGHARLRIVGEGTRMAMPEVGIGLVPDVGSTWILGRAPGRVGEFLAMTGQIIGPGDAIHAGFADRFLPEAGWPGLLDRLAATGDPGILPASDACDAPLSRRDLRAFTGADVAAVLAALDQADPATAATIRSRSPLAVAAALLLVRAARGDRSLRDSIAREFRFTARAVAESDLLEGIRAQVIDKDRKPRWTAGADRAQALLAPLGDGEFNMDDAA
ncbi:MAG: enoyl-CoA hydratase/isomerase family protein [Rubellimicrobium sp.]|nr:enoyl-CoA hydratase/isomerase family protein [Rubellimicrobium sp.]